MGQSDRTKRTSFIKAEEYTNLETEVTTGSTEVKVDSEPILPYNKEIKVSITSLLDARLVYAGQVTGKQYEWIKAGSVVEVDAEDSEILLAKRIYGTCCGNSRDGQPIFK